MNPANNYYFPMAKYRYLPRILRSWIAVDQLAPTALKSEDWDGLELRVGDNVARILDLFDAAGVKATFFTLGWVAERNKPAMRAIEDDVVHTPPDTPRADRPRPRLRQHAPNG